MNQFAGLIAGLIAAFSVTFLVIPWLIPKLVARGMVGKDFNKPQPKEVAEMGGIAVVIGFFSGLSLSIIADDIADAELLYISLTAVLGAAFVGVVDDLFDLRHRHKAILPFLIALPLGAALDSSVFIPHIGELDLGPLMILAAPFAVTCAANAGNMLEGFNGLGAGLGIIMSSALIILAFHHNRLDGLYVLMPLFGGLLAFVWFNRYPSRIFPGDTLMLFMGSTIAVGGMLSNLYAQTAIIFIPMIIEFFLKFRGHFKAENYSTDALNGHLVYDGRIESLTHILMRAKRLSERGLVAVLWSIEAILASSVILLDLAL